MGPRRRSARATTSPPDATSPQEKARAVVWRAFGNSGPPSLQTVSPTYALEILRHRHDQLGDVAVPSQALWIAGELGLERPSWVLDHLHRSSGEVAWRSKRLSDAGKKKKRASAALGRELAQAYGFTTGKRGHASTLSKGDALERDQRLANEVALRMLPKATAFIDRSGDAQIFDDNDKDELTQKLRTGEIRKVPGSSLRIGSVPITGGDNITAATKKTAARHGVSERTVRRAWADFLAWQHALELNKSADRPVARSTTCPICGTK